MRYCLSSFYSAIHVSNMFLTALQEGCNYYYFYLNIYFVYYVSTCLCILYVQLLVDVRERHYLLELELQVA